MTARVEVLERRIKAIEVEWDEWYDKYRRLYARLAKRVERAQTDDPDEGKGNGTPPRLSPGQEAFLATKDPVSRAIWERRLRG